MTTGELAGGEGLAMIAAATSWPAERTDTDVFGFETWEVRDPFLVPVTIMAVGAPTESGDVRLGVGADE